MLENNRLSDIEDIGLTEVREYYRLVIRTQVYHKNIKGVYI